MNVGNPRTPIRNVMERAFSVGLSEGCGLSVVGIGQAWPIPKMRHGRIAVCDRRSVAQSAGNVEKESEHGGKRFFAVQSGRTVLS